MTSVAVLGAGAWGTAIARRIGSSPSRRAVRARSAAGSGHAGHRRQQRYLRGVRLPHELIVVDDFEAAVRHAGSGLLVIATPTRALGDICARLAMTRTHGSTAWLCKGFEEERHLLGHEVVERVGPRLSGAADRFRARASRSRSRRACRRL